MATHWYATDGRFVAPDLVRRFIPDHDPEDRNRRAYLRVPSRTVSLEGSGTVEEVGFVVVVVVVGPGRIDWVPLLCV